MRKTPSALAGLAVLALSATALVGCTSGAPAACERPAVSDAAVMNLVTVTGDADTAPDIEIPKPLRADVGGYQDIVTGDGTPLTSANQLLVMDVTLVSGATGETLIQAPDVPDLTRVFSLSQWVEALPGLESALQCATEGSRVAVVLAPDDIREEAAVTLGLTDTDSAVAVVDLRKVYLPRAEGALQFNTGRGLPSVVRAPDGRPGISFPEASAPTSLEIQTLIKGAGPVVTGDAPVRVHYTGVVWGANEAFDSTWDAEPASMNLASVVPGFAAAITGQTVGSQVMVVVPPEEGYGDQASGPIPANSTLVFVIDILGIDAAATP